MDARIDRNGRHTRKHQPALRRTPLSPGPAAVLFGIALIAVLALAPAAPARQARATADPIIVAGQSFYPVNGVAGDNLGQNVDLDGTTVVTGVPGRTVVYVFTHDGSGWVTQQEVRATGNPTLFGSSVAVDGDTLVVGANVYGYVFTRSGSTWTQRQVLVPANDCPGGGTTVAIDGDTIVLGDAYKNQTGAQAGGRASVFTRSAGTWTEQQQFWPADVAAYAHFGQSVAVHGDTAIIGAPGVSFAPTPGAAHVYTRSGGTWTQQQRLTASDGAVRDAFGSSTAIFDDTALVGAPNGNAAYVFTRSGATWTQEPRLAPAGLATGSSFGCAVALDDSLAVVGAYGAASDHGAIYCFQDDGTSWTERDSEAWDSVGRFGSAVAADGYRVAAGVPWASVPADKQGMGVVYSLGTTVTPASGPPGTRVTLLGMLRGATGVTFNGIPADDFTAVSESRVTAVVPPRAKSGSVLAPGSHALAAGFTATGWRVQNEVEGFLPRFMGASFPTDQSGWVAGSEGEILATSNGGDTWTPQSSGAGSLHDVSFPDTSHGWAVGESNVIVSTANGGLTWSPQASGTTSSLVGVHFVTSERGWVVGEDGVILTTANGGSTWTPQTSGITSSLSAVDFVSASQGWAVGWGGMVLCTGNGGQTWSRQTVPSTVSLTDVDFGDATHGVTVGLGEVLSTDDGGATWTSRIQGGDFMGVTLPDGLHGWVADYMSSRVLATVDGGATWSEQPLPITISWGLTLLHDVAASDAAHAWAVGSQGHILATNSAYGFPGPLPDVSGFSPSEGTAGTTVTVTGTDFTGATALNFNGIPGTDLVVDSPTQLRVNVPEGDATGKLTVVTPGGADAASSDFTVSAPTISGFSPASGPEYTVVAVTGTGFVGPTTVSFNGVESNANVTSPTSLLTAVPEGATTGKVAVTTAGGTATSTDDFTVGSGVPTITSFSPTSGLVGAEVTIDGEYFTDATAVTFNGTAAAGFTVVSETRLTAIVPVGATTGKIAVSAPSGTATSTGNFTVTAHPAPTLTSFTPTSGFVGTGVTLTGTGFIVPAQVTFNGVEAVVMINSPTSISTWVPEGATTGKVAVTTPGGTAESAGDFTVLPKVTVSAPTAASSWPAGSAQSVSWTLDCAAPSGQFQVSLVNQATNAWYVNKLVPAAGAQTLYSASVIAAVPAGSYKAAVYWRPAVGSGAWTSTAKSVAFKVTPINITVPAAGAVWAAQATCTVSWNVNPAMDTGQFQVALVNQATSAWYVNKLVAAVAGKTSYSAAVNTLVPPGTYKAAVYWRATPGSGAFTATQKSAAFTIATLAVTSPTASSSWPRRSTQSVSWSVTPGLSSGEFRVSLVSSTNLWYVNRTVAAVAGQTDYSTPVFVAVPAVGSYRAAVYWRPSATASWILTKKTPAFAVTL